MTAAVEALSLDRERFLSVLEKLIAEVEPHLMNQPPKYVPQESMAGRHILKALEPYTEANGGPLKVRELAYHEGRGNIIIEYPGTGSKTVAFAGTHLDVVHASREGWDKDPFKLTVEGDKMYGRGTTDCLGHAALLTELFTQLGQLRPKLSVSVIAVIIVDEEVGDDPTIGVEALQAHGELDRLKNGPVFWLDAADKQPNIGSGGVIQWRLTAYGKLGHSGFPNKVVNAIELASDALAEIQRRFYCDFPRHEREKEYGFPCPSSLKPTNVITHDGTLTQIRSWCTFEGDVRLIPFYRIADVQTKVESYIKDLNDSKFASLHGTSFHARGPHVRYDIDDSKPHIKWEWLAEGADGLACDLSSPGFKLLAEATTKYVGKLAPSADTGSLPLVGQLQAAGYDIQYVGYGLEDYYHADNEQALVSDFEQGFKCLAYIVAHLHEE